ncbi:MAG: hypothetical protein HY711_06530, partial [Candidatus Melainabacteria bacterium]|nr:hypothetical protein [Candidatus Melainabacteria bacterium]
MQVKPTNIPTRVAALKQHLESLFPGKWVSSQELQKALRTGLPTIDRILTSGLVRQRITEWVGSLSSGKTTVLRMVIANWCTAGFHIAYIDLEDKLVASDWSFELNSDNPGRFWVVKLSSRRQPHYYIICDQLLRSNAFDVVI